MTLYPTADTRIAGAALPDTAIDWQDDQGNLIDFSTGHTFTLRASRTPGTPPVIVKTLGITGSDTSPNINISWTLAEAAALTAGTWIADIAATRDTDNKPRILRIVLPIRSAV
jgi:hypothetical protein